MTNRDPEPSRFARQYATLAPVMDARGAGTHRAELVAGLAGVVAEIGCGPGSMFEHYRPPVRRVVAAEPDAYLRGLAAARARRTGQAMPVTVLAGRAEALPLGDGSVDAVVCSLVLCSVTDQQQVLAEVRRVLRASGSLRFYEHVRSGSRLVGWAQDAVTPLWRRAAGGCHPNRDTVAAIRAAGFVVTDVQRFGFSPAPLAPRMAHVLGAARLVNAPAGG